MGYFSVFFMASVVDCQSQAIYDYDTTKISS